MGGDKVEVIFRNCSVLSLSRKALLILFRFILQEKKTKQKNITTLYKGTLQVKKVVENKRIFHECAASLAGLNVIQHDEEKDVVYL